MVLMSCCDKVSFMGQLLISLLDGFAKSSGGLWLFYYAQFANALTVLISNSPMTQLNAHQWQGSYLSYQKSGFTICGFASDRA